MAPGAAPQPGTGTTKGPGHGPNGVGRRPPSGPAPPHAPTRTKGDGTRRTSRAPAAPPRPPKDGGGGKRGGPAPFRACGAETDTARRRPRSGPRGSSAGARATQRAGQSRSTLLNETNQAGAAPPPVGPPPISAGRDLSERAADRSCLDVSPRRGAKSSSCRRSFARMRPLCGRFRRFSPSRRLRGGYGSFVTYKP